MILIIIIMKLFNGWLKELYNSHVKMRISDEVHYVLSNTNQRQNSFLLNENDLSRCPINGIQATNQPNTQWCSVGFVTSASSQVDEASNSHIPK